MCRADRLISAPPRSRGSCGSPPPPHALIPALLLTLVLLLSACSASATSTAHTGAASPTATGGAADSTSTALPTPKPSTTDCSQVSGFDSAGPASAGSGFTDVTFPADSVSISGTTSTQVYTFQLINVCSNHASAASV